MNTKKLAILQYLTLLLFFSGCEDLLDRKPDSTISTSSFWETEDDVRTAVNGMYTQFRSTFDVKTVIWGEFRTGFYGPGASGGNGWDDLWDNNLNSSTTRTNWSDLYLLINDVNLIISKSADISFRNENEKNHLLGQAYFVRAFAYFQVVKLWGDAPLTTQGFESTIQQLELPRSPKSEIFDQIKRDIDSAKNLLQERESVNFIGIQAANMLQADVYLWTAKLENGGDEDLQSALAAVDEVLEGNFTLESDFESVFRDESSPEIIFSTFYSQLEAGSGESSGSSGRTQTGTHPSHITLPSLNIVPPDLHDAIPVAPNPQWLDLSAYFTNNVLKPSGLDSRTDVTWQSATAASGAVTTWINKYIGEEISGTRISTSDFIIYRFAEAVLFKAEIENALGNTDVALTYLNKIAARAYGVPDYYTGLSKAEIDNAILNERILEFVLEGKSWYDIRRFRQAFERIPSLAGREGDNNGNILLFPVAQDVINRNPKIVQTDGY